MKSHTKYKPFFDDPKSLFWHRKPLEMVPLQLRRGEFQQFNSKTLKMETISLEFNTSFLIRSKLDQSVKIDAYNATIQLIQGPQLGISIYKSGYQYQFFGNITEWYTTLKHYCIQVDFEEKYEYIKLISTGTYSKVYEIKLTQKQKQSHFAAKVYDKSLLQEEKEKISLFKEIDILRHLNHPGVIKLEEVYENQDKIILIFQYLDGGDLQKYLRKKGKAISESIVKRFAQKLLQTLQYIHSKGILHRDIKLANIMLKGDDIILTDFGMAEFYRQDGQYMYQRCGTAGFVAPEILQNKPYDQSVDIYSLGIVLYILLAGRHPFKATTYEQTLYLNSIGEICFKINTTPDCINFLQGMLTSDKQNRQQISQLLEHNWLGMEKLFDRKPSYHYKLVPKQLGSQKKIITEYSPQSTSRSPFNLYKITPYYLTTHKQNNNLVLQNKLKKCFSQSVLHRKSKSPDPKNQITFQFIHYGGQN